MLIDRIGVTYVLSLDVGFWVGVHRGGSARVSVFCSACTGVSGLLEKDLCKYRTSNKVSKPNQTFHLDPNLLMFQGGCTDRPGCIDFPFILVMA